MHTLIKSSELEKIALLYGVQNKLMEKTGGNLASAFAKPLATTVGITAVPYGVGMLNRTKKVLTGSSIVDDFTPDVLTDTVEAAKGAIAGMQGSTAPAPVPANPQDFPFWQKIKYIATGQKPPINNPEVSASLPAVSAVPSVSSGTSAVPSVPGTTPAVPSVPGTTPAVPSGPYEKARNAVSSIGNVMNNVTRAVGAGQGVQDFVSRYGMPILGLTALTALASGGKKKRDAHPSTGQPINISINTGRERRSLLGDDPGEVGIFSKYGSYLSKKADIITDALVNVAKNRVANQVLDKVIKNKNSSTSKEKKEEHPKIELVSKSPGMKKLLEKEENKQYLEKLISEKS